MSAPKKASVEEVRAQVGKAIDVLRLIAEAIRESKEIPSGHLYALVMGSMSIEAYTAAINLLKRAKLVEETGHLLRWVGPNDVDGVAP